MPALARAPVVSPLFQFPPNAVSAYPASEARPEKFLSPARLAPASGQADPAPDSDSGQTLLTGFFNDRSGLRLVDHSGRTLHEWSASYLEVFPDPTHLDSVPKHDWDVHLHGAVLYPNGDVVFNFEWAGLVRLDRCSKVLWKLARQTHHSMELDDDGNLWIPDRKRRLVPSADMPDVPVPVWDDYLVQVSPDGKVLREIPSTGTCSPRRTSQPVGLRPTGSPLPAPVPDDRKATGGAGDGRRLTAARQPSCRAQGSRC